MQGTCQFVGYFGPSLGSVDVGSVSTVRHDIISIVRSHNFHLKHGFKASLEGVSIVETISKNEGTNLQCVKGILWRMIFELKQGWKCCLMKNIIISVFWGKYLLWK